MSASSVRCFDDARELGAFPTGDGFLISFAGAALGFLRRPAESLAEEAADMIVVKSNAEMVLDQLGDARRGPQGIGPAVRHRTLLQQGFQLAELLIGHLPGPMRMRLGCERGFGLALTPAVHRRPMHAQEACDACHAFPLAEQGDTTMAPPFEFFRCSKRSTHTRLDALTGQKMHWLRSCQ
jgi:hypothetical protein